MLSLQDKMNNLVKTEYKGHPREP